MSESTLSVLSLNCWGLYIVAKQRRFRLQAIANDIAQHDYDIVALQEVWMWEDVDYIKDKVKDKLPFAHHFHSGTLGSGLVLLSRFPVLASSYVKFSLAGRPLKIFQGDFYVGKGCSKITVEHPVIGLIDVYTTHLQAGYGLVDTYEAQRITECWQIAQCVRDSAAQGRHVILTGDFNSLPTSHCYQILKLHGFMTDSWLQVHEQSIEQSLSRLSKNELKASDCIEQFGITCNSPLNTWTQHFSKQPETASKQRDIGDRLDYIFYRKTPHFTCQSSKVVMEEYIPGTEMSFSDHFGVHSIFTYNSSGQGQKYSTTADAPSLEQWTRPDITQMPLESLNGILHLIEKEIQQAHQTFLMHLCTFGLSVVLVLIIYIIQIVIPQVYYYEHDSHRLVSLFLSNALCGLSLIVLSVIAIVSLIVGFVFGKMEQRTLNQFKLDIQLLLVASTKRKETERAILSQQQEAVSDESNSNSNSSITLQDA